MSEPTPANDSDDATLLRRFLADRDVACPRCGYNLRAASGDRCVECGTAIRLGVHPIEPVLRAWIVAASIGAGIGLLFIALALGHEGLPPRRYLWIVFGSWVCIPIAVSLAVARYRFVRLHQARAQWLIASALCVGVIVLLIGLSVVR